MPVSGRSARRAPAEAHPFPSSSHAAHRVRLSPADLAPGAPCRPRTDSQPGQSGVREHGRAVLSRVWHSHKGVGGELGLGRGLRDSLPHFAQHLQTCCDTEGTGVSGPRGPRVPGTIYFASCTRFLLSPSSTDESVCTSSAGAGPGPGTMARGVRGAPASGPVLAAASAPVSVSTSCWNRSCPETWPIWLQP